MYVIDRATGEVISAETYAYQNASEGVDLNTGRIKINPAKSTGLKTVKDICPAPPGGKYWQSSAFSLRTGWLYVPHNPLPPPGVKPANNKLLRWIFTSLR